MTTLYVDVETRSPTPITCGTYRYAEDAEGLMISWAVDDGPTYIEDLTAIPPSGDLDSAFEHCDRIVAHNANFDRVILARLGFEAPLEKWECTMARAYAHSLPGALESLCTIYNMNDALAKMKGGRRFIQLFCVPRRDPPAAGREALYDFVGGAWFATARSHPEDWEGFRQYSLQDIPPLRELDKKLPRWNWGPEEQAVWRRNQRINDRGMQIDVELTDAAINTVAAHKKRLQKRTGELTGTDLVVTQRDALLAHVLAEYGVELPDMRAATLERTIDDDTLPEDARELLRIRLSYCQTSTAKWGKLRDAVCHDGRLRGTAQYCGASRTGRDGGRIFQPLNLPRPPKYLKKVIATGVDLIKQGVVDLAFDDPIEVCSAALRGAIIAPPGKKLLIADLNAIEGRMAAWISGEQWKLDAYARGSDLYVLAYAKSFGKRAEDVTEDERQVGKVEELALQFGGATGAFGSMARVYGVELSEDTQLAVVRAWRRANPEIVSTWYELEDAVRSILTCPNGHEISVRKLRVTRNGPWVRVILPSGRSLCYPFMKVEDDGQLCYMGVHQYTRKWTDIRTYGGKLYENAVQGSARDVLVYGMGLMEDDGLDTVLTVYDEAVSEAPLEYPLERYTSLLATTPPWAPDLPLAAGGFETDRYRKD